MCSGGSSCNRGSIGEILRQLVGLTREQGRSYQMNEHMSTQVEQASSDLLANCFDCGLLEAMQWIRPSLRRAEAFFLRGRKVYKPV